MGGILSCKGEGPGGRLWHFRVAPLEASAEVTPSAPGDTFLLVGGSPGGAQGARGPKLPPLCPRQSRLSPSAHLRLTASGRVTTILALWVSKAELRVGLESQPACSTQVLTIAPRAQVTADSRSGWGHGLVLLSASCQSPPRSQDRRKRATSIGFLPSPSIRTKNSCAFCILLHMHSCLVKWIVFTIFTNE